MNEKRDGDVWCYACQRWHCGTAKGEFGESRQHEASPDQLMTESAAGRYLGGNRAISVGTMQSWRYDGTGPSWIKVGRQIRYRRSALDAYLASQVVEVG